ncbi:hypothetical protein EC957_006196 [Mortierella hygrophila]|uniref:Uncharacterized protein n=1 Tax=Mortierella hygrophila TaxID=979708 RepID=A0A9P6JZC7_9FUNG|nr:hypothetical protein EC957_006196 [Mortierella hygrophila]
MSDHIHTDNNALHSLSLEEVATLRALVNSHISQPTTTPTPTTIDAPRTQLLVISDEVRELIPAISGHHFFFPPADPDEDTISPDDLQQYTAPALVRIIERQAQSTRPLDDFAIEFFANVTDPTAKQTVAEFTQVMRSNLANNAREPVPEKKKGVSISQEVIKANIKAAEEYAKALPAKKQVNG